MMKVAIPPDDIGSRGAIQYAHEITEALAIYGVRLMPNEGYSGANIRLAMAEMDRTDTPTST